MSSDVTANPGAMDWVGAYVAVVPSMDLADRQASVIAVPMGDVDGGGGCDVLATAREAEGLIEIQLGSEHDGTFGVEANSDVLSAHAAGFRVQSEPADGPRSRVLASAGTVRIEGLDLAAATDHLATVTIDVRLPSTASLGCQGFTGSSTARAQLRCDCRDAHGVVSTCVQDVNVNTETCCDQKETFRFQATIPALFCREACILTSMGVDSLCPVPR